MPEVEVSEVEAPARAEPTTLSLSNWKPVLDRIRLARAGAAVERCHTTPHLQRYSVGQHSLDLITLILITWRAEYGELPRAEMLIAAAYHDIPEMVTGDISAPIKPFIDMTAVAEIERRVLRYMGADFELTAREAAWIKWCDKLELALWCVEEGRRGNSAFTGWAEWLLAGKDLPDAILAVFDNRDYVAKLPVWEELRKMGGL